MVQSLKMYPYFFGYVGVLVSPEAYVLTDGLVALVVEYDVATFGITHTAVHLQILEIGVCCSLLQAEYVTLADTFQYVG